jgi:hypothetical protein
LFCAGADNLPANLTGRSNAVISGRFSGVAGAAARVLDALSN